MTTPWTFACALACCIGILASGTGCGGDASPCAPSCAARQCGDDGCGGSCGTCTVGLCDEATGTCLGCIRDCAGKRCGDDDCGGSCGTCLGGAICNTRTFECVGGCLPDCTEHNCGDDGCEGSCGTCAVGATCVQGRCGPCQRQCDGRTCGDDGCSATCGTCGASQECVAGNCAETASCIDGRANGQETDVDCGGSCPTKCLAGRGCLAGTDCESGTCGPGAKCTAAPSCGNGTKDPDETDDDCGGSCPPCELGRACEGHRDCVSATCVHDLCAAPDCDDDLRNGGETDTDCGGGDCDPCADGKSCAAAGDCVGGRCDGNKCCTTNACGSCGPPPAEACDGQDNDCNGAIDDALGAADLCPLQKGVCQGSRGHCAGFQGWQCDAAEYGAGYQQWESLCDDGRDNDCDGLTDWADKPGCCQRDCTGKDCGSDGCTGNCGVCGDGLTCQSGKCQVVCGGDPGNTCQGACGDPYCSPEQCPGPGCPPDYAACCPDCITPCLDRQCGINACRIDCGSCPGGAACVNFHCDKSGPCQGVPRTGCCVDDRTQAYCSWDSGTGLSSLATWLCNYSGNTRCGWDSTLRHYECRTHTLSDPSGQFPRLCSHYGIAP